MKSKVEKFLKENGHKEILKLDQDELFAGRSPFDPKAENPDREEDEAPKIKK